MTRIRADRPSRVPWPAVVVYVLVACGLAWLVALPLWVLGPEEPAFTTLFSPLASATMFTPLLAVLLVVFVLKQPRGERLRTLGMWPLRPARRVVWCSVAAVFAPPILVGASLAVAVLFGWMKLDLVGFSAFAATLDAQLDGLGPGLASAMPPIGVLVALQLIAIPLGAVFNTIPAFGEEVGWRGWLLPNLRPLGTWPALALSGAIWGLWHSPLILLGYNFGRTDWSGVALMTIGCVFWGVLFGWVRLRTGSVWPAAVGHGALNAAAGLFLLFADADALPDPALVSPLGVAGWIVVGVVVLVLALAGQFRVQPELAPKRVRSAAAAPAPEGSGEH